ncbi:MAG: DUF4384 domain-containing protein [Albidovulum sp.]
MFHRTRLIPLLALLALTAAGPTFAEEGNVDPALHVGRDDGRDGGPPQAGDFRLQISKPDRQYRLKDRIEFHVSGNRDFFLWAYTVDRDGQATVLVPGPSQAGNKYDAGRRYRVPNPGVSFFADETGPHQITVVATTRWFDIDRWLQRHAQKSGDLLSVPAAELETAFGEMGVRIGPDRPVGGGAGPDRQEVVVRYLDFDVTR